jgi:hypothetical protein
MVGIDTTPEQLHSKISRTPSSDEIAGGRGPVREGELKSRGEEAAGDGELALRGSLFPGRGDLMERFQASKHRSMSASMMVTSSRLIIASERPLV